MPSGTHIAEVQAALEAKLTAELPGVMVRGLTGNDFEEETERLIVAPPAVLVQFTREEFPPTREHIGLTYQSSQHFVVICGGRSLRSENEERVVALELLSKVCNALAGARLTLPSSSQEPIVKLQTGVSLGQFDKEDTWYTLPIVVESVSQFGGNS